MGERVCLIRIHRQRWELASFACTSLIDSDVNNVISSTAQEYGFRARGRLPWHWVHNVMITVCTDNVSLIARNGTRTRKHFCRGSGNMNMSAF